MPSFHRTRSALFLVCIARAGYVNGGRLIEFIEEWARCVEAHGRGVGIEEFAAWSTRFSTRTAYARLSLFRKTFPQLGEHGVPSGLMAPLLERLAAESQEALDGGVIPA